MLDQNKFIARLIELRDNMGISKAELAEKVGISKQAIGQFENGKTMPSIHTFIALADFFGVSLDYLLGRSDDPKGTL